MSELSYPPEEQKTDFLSDILSRPFITSLNLDWEKCIYLLFLVVAVVTRFWALGDRVMSHDESLHTQFSFQFFDGQGYQHTPLMHGPFLFHITSLAYWLFGDNDFAARIPVAIFGIVLILMPYFLRPQLGRVGALFTSFIFLISPYVTYYSRYIRHDVYIIVWALIIFVTFWAYFRERKDKYLWWFAAALALMFATKEVAFIYVAIFGSYLIIRLLVKISPTEWFREALSNLRAPIMITIVGIVMIGAGLVAQTVVDRTVVTAVTPTTAEGFAADPTADPTETNLPEESGFLETTLRWTQIAGLGIFGLGLFLGLRKLRPGIDESGEFDFIILFTSLILPMISPLLTTMAGWNPRDYALSTCMLQGQETMNALQILIGRLGNATCWTSYAQSGIVRSGFFLILTLVIGVLLGLWWNRRRWLISAVIFYTIFTILYTSLFTNLGGWTSGMIGSLGYWLEQQAVQRGSQPSFYYFIVVPIYEFLPLIFSFLAVRLWSKMQRTNRVIGYWLLAVILAFMAYSLSNWAYATAVADPLVASESTILPGLVAAVLILVLAIAYWFMRQRRKLIEIYQLTGGIKELFGGRALLDFVPFVTWWLLLTWVAYTYAGEKMPWLSIHFVIPMGFLVGWYFNEKLAHLDVHKLFSRSALLVWGLTLLLIIAIMLLAGPLLLGRLQLGDQAVDNLASMGQFLGGLIVAGGIFFIWLRAYQRIDKPLRNPLLLFSIFTLLALLTIRFTFMSSFKNADYTNEFMVYAHGAPATKSVVMQQIEEMSMRLEGDKGIKVAFDNDTSWPFTWYLREYPNRVYFGENPSQSLTESPIIIVGNVNWDKVEPYLGNNYQSTQHTFLWWPMEEYRKINLNAILGDLSVPAEQRRGLGNADVREALWDIFFYRDYQKYGETFGGTYTAGEWPLRHELRMYVRNDVLPTMWDYGIGALSAGGLEDPYAEGELTVFPTLILNDAGVTGSGPGQLSFPRNVAVDDNGRIYVADSGNSRIQVFAADGTTVTNWGTFGTEPGQFNEPWGITVDDEFVYVADTWNHRIQKFSQDGVLIDTFGGSGGPTESDNGLGLFFGPRSIITLNDGRFLVTDTGNHRMQLFDNNGNFTQQVGSFGNLLGEMNEPVGLSQGPDGNIFLADTWNGRIQTFSADLLPLNEWPVNGWEGTSINNKPYTAVDSAGRVYVTDPEGFRVLIFSADGNYIGRFGSFGSESNNLNIPNGIFIDAEDNVYVADSGNHRILKFGPLFGPSLNTIDEGAAPIDESSSDQNSVDEAYPADEE